MQKIEKYIKNFINVKKTKKIIKSNNESQKP